MAGIAESLGAFVSAAAFAVLAKWRIGRSVVSGHTEGIGAAVDTDIPLEVQVHQVTLVFEDSGLSQWPGKQSMGPFG